MLENDLIPRETEAMETRQQHSEVGKNIKTVHTEFLMTFLVVATANSVTPGLLCCLKLGFQAEGQREIIP